MEDESFYTQDSWEGWELDRKSHSLFHDDPGGGYYIDVSRCRSSAETLDWIMQVTHKSWADNHVIGGLIRALDDLIDPQGTLCPGGRSRNVSLSYLLGRINNYGLWDEEQ
jgi:hypothetical protein